MNANRNLPPGCLSGDLDGARDYDAAFCTMLERIDDRRDLAKGDHPMRQMAEIIKLPVAADPEWVIFRGRVLEAANWLRLGAPGKALEVLENILQS